MRTTTDSYLNMLGSQLPVIVYEVTTAEAAYGDISSIQIPTFAESISNYAKELLDRLRYLKRTYATPFDPSGLAPDTKAFRDAEQFVLNLPLNKMGTPQINVASDGEVNFDWSADDYRIDLGFYGNGRYSYFGRRGQQETIGEDILVADDLPTDLLQIATSSL